VDLYLDRELFPETVAGDLDPELDQAVLDRIDEIVTPGTVINPADSSYPRPRTSSTTTERPQLTPSTKCHRPAARCATLILIESVSATSQHIQLSCAGCYASVPRQLICAGRACFGHSEAVVSSPSGIGCWPGR
jgi:hypothetical protein